MAYLQSRSMNNSNPRLSYTSATAQSGHPYQWKRDTNDLLQGAERARENAAKSMERSKNIEAKAVSSTDNIQEASTEAIQSQIASTSQLKEQLQEQLALTETEMDALEEQRKFLFAELTSLQEPIATANECLLIRERRPPREKTRDNVERALIEQAGTVQNSVNLLTQAYEACTRELQRLAEHRQLIAMDIQDKKNSIELDTRCLNLNPRESMALGEAGLNTATVDLKGVDSEAKSGGLPYVWRQSSANLMTTAQSLRTTSARVREECDRLKQDARQVETEQRRRADEALRRKLNETSELRTVLENKLLELEQQMHELEDARSGLEQSLTAKQPALAMAVQRLNIRQQRPAREQVRDSVEVSLEQEVAANKNAIAKMEWERQKLLTDIDKLGNSRSSLVQDIQDKTDAIALDHECLEQQGRIPDQVSSAIKQCLR